MKIDEAGIIHKELEAEFNRRLVPYKYTMARLDGRAFHTLTKNLNKPFDKEFCHAMRASATSLLNTYNADLAYTQSDEITLLWGPITNESSELMFGGGLNKFISLLAASCSVKFNKELNCKKDEVFDCRVWQVNSLDLVVSNLHWRILDASRNSLNMVASSLFSHKELQGKSSSQREQMIRDKNFDWDSLLSSYKVGLFIYKELEERSHTSEELANIPEEHRPTGPVLRPIIKYESGAWMKSKDHISDFLTIRILKATD